MLNIGFKQMAGYAMAGVVSLMFPSILLNFVAPLGWFAFAYTACVLFLGMIFVFYPAMKQLNEKDSELKGRRATITRLRKIQQPPLPSRDEKGRFVKHE